MELTIPYRYIEDRSQVVEVITLADVVKVQRSSAGFKTSTGTTRTCQRCRQLDGGTNRREPWPVAIWLLTGEVFGDRRVIQLGLCSNHFKELREEERNTRARGMSPEAQELNMGVDVTDYLKNATFHSDDSVYSAWERSVQLGEEE